MQIHVVRGKGNKDRYTILSRKLLEELRKYYRSYRPKEWLFPGQNKTEPIHQLTLQKAFKESKKSKDYQASYSTFITPQFCHPFIRKRM
jgi:integrase